MTWSTMSPTTSRNGRTTPWTGGSDGCASTARARPALSRRDTRKCPQRTATLASPSSFPATWAATPTSSLGTPRRLPGDLRLHLPRRGPAHEPPPGEAPPAAATCAASSKSAGSRSGHPRSGPSPRRSPRRTRTWPMWSTSSTAPASAARSPASGPWACSRDEARRARRPAGGHRPERRRGGGDRRGSAGAHGRATAAGSGAPLRSPRSGGGPHAGARPARPRAPPGGHRGGLCRAALHVRRPRSRAGDGDRTGAGDLHRLPRPGARDAGGGERGPLARGLRLPAMGGLAGGAAGGPRA